jgi:hypothetical protein
MLNKVLGLLFPTNYSKKSFDYLTNDPTTPNLVEKVKYPLIGNLRFEVKDLNFKPKNPNEKRSLNCFITIGNFLTYVQHSNRLPIKKWAATDVLSINCLAGKDLNAFYDRRSLRFYYEKKGFKTIYMADSADVVSHELGHAILDAIRPDFWSVQSKEIWAFHEAFSDICSIVSIMQYEQILQKAIEETNNNLSASNVISRLAEEVGIFVYENYSKNNGYLTNALRDPAVEIFKYIKPENLPEDARNDQLSSECHSYGRVFLSVWYNILCKIYAKEVEKNAPLTAIKNARDISFLLLLQAIPVSPRVNNYHNAIAKCMVSIAKSKYADYAEIIENCFFEWNILNKSVKMLSNTSKEEVIANLSRKDEVIKNKNSIMIKLTRQKTIKIPNISILSNEGSKDIELEVAADQYYEFDKNGNLIDEIIPDQEEIADSAVSCLSYIEKNKNIKNPMWTIQDGKLIRSYIS